METPFQQRKFRNSPKVISVQTCTDDTEKRTIVPRFKRTTKHIINSNEPRITPKDLSRIKDIYVDKEESDYSHEDPQISDVVDLSEAEHDFEWESTQMKKGLPQKSLTLLPTTSANEPTIKISEIEAELELEITALNQQLVTLRTDKNRIQDHDPSYLSCLDFLYELVQHGSNISDDALFLERFPPNDILTAFNSSGIDEVYLAMLFELPLIHYLRKNQIVDVNSGVQEFIDSNSLPISLMADLIDHANQHL